MNNKDKVCSRCGCKCFIKVKIKYQKYKLICLKCFKIYKKGKK